ncbi:aspartate dehydrogenase [Paraburkholderia lycopersici]|uniref:L-aspartate dehydrogenase n=1 Tax=Paraburkholderia lycopersici TaxID=416944 RepID=A0A1G6QCK5_9BURK|nr:aspartate dehydrogenase [Paraburkholderia lycopersici]SDC89426.1 aspartate dehydrogenase [Paraburkholderia lycopersici]
MLDLKSPTFETARRVEARSTPLRATLIGFGSIGSAVFDAFASDPAIVVDQIVVSPRSVAETARRVGPAATVASRVDALPGRPDIAIECAGHRAVREHVVPLLRMGVECAMVSIGALADDAVRDACEAAALEGGGRVSLLSGAFGGLDALAAAAVGGLDDVLYTGSKPVEAWRGTPADAAGALDGLRHAATIFEGTARDTAQRYPKNANVAAAVALAGAGFERTRVRLVADPAAVRNTHVVRARGEFGELCIEIAATPCARNPKTSALTAFSAIRFLRDRARSGIGVMAARP